MQDTLTYKILKTLETKQQSTQELATSLGASLGTVRGILCLLKKDNLVEPKPEEKKGKPFQLTKKGKQYLETQRK